MAERRIFAKTIIDSDAFTEMPLSTQALYFHLSMRADDDGFLNCAQKILRMIGAAKNDFDLLLAKRFIIQFNDGICVIKHWRIHNYIQSDRYKPTVYQDEKAALSIKANGSYTLKSQEIKELDTQCIQDGYTLEAQVSIGKDSIVKDSADSADKPRKSVRKFIPPTLEEVAAYITENGYDVDARKFHKYYSDAEPPWHDQKGAPVKNWKQKIITWSGRSKSDKPAQPKPRVFKIGTADYE